ncbi:carbon-nitrogen hydrolase family protein [Methanobacterium oryzae]|uniref:carbon-nitrogen hydrolase family protein n=1 Tax=Methanobacterium oryzae TaxID=69540 RepID=UPI003D1B46BC
MKEFFKLAICQMKVVDEKRMNINRAVSMIEDAAQNKADLIVLPEMFNCPYDINKFKEYAEKREDSKTLKAISNISKGFGVHIIAGSIPELDNGKIYNSSFAFNNGKIVGLCRKIHLFDIDIPDKITFKESEVLTAGNQITVLDTKLCKIGLSICYDMRFPELLRIMALKGAQIIVIPGAFNMTTGPAHWETLIRARAIDNQIYVAAASPARNNELSYVAYGNSMIVNPWGTILARANEKEDIIYADINLKEVKKVREELPVLKNRRNNIYEIIEK